MQSRSESFDSIPEAEFLKLMISDELEALDHQLEERFVSEHKKLEMSGALQPEPLLIEDKSRFVLFPIKQPDVRRCESSPLFADIR
jgi:hypothetical protein